MQQNNAVVSAMAQRMGVNSQDIELAHQAREYREQVQQEITSDPERFVESRVQRVMQQQFAAFENYLNNRTQAQQFVSQHQDLISDPKSQSIMARALDESVSRSDIAIELAKLSRENERLLANAHVKTADVETLRAKDELANRQVIPSRRASTNTIQKSDPWDSYNKNAVDPKAQEKLLDNLFKRT
jgi:hypothetical protein